MIYDKLVTVQYPSGSFGHFTHLILSNYGKDFNSVDSDDKFANDFKSGSSHFTTSTIEKYYDKEKYAVYAATSLEQDYRRITKNGKSATVIVDSGITDDTNNYMAIFPGATYVRVCYDDYSWPFSAKSFYTRCMSEVLEHETSIGQFIQPDAGAWDNTEPWAVREKYFLYLKEHQFRHDWQPVDGVINIDVRDYMSYDTLYPALSKVGPLDDFKILYDKFYVNNAVHISWYVRCVDVFNSIKNHENIDLVDLQNDLFSQATINYFIQIHYGFEIPAYDYRDWFKSTGEIFDMFKLHSISY
jgi:hypothetical protein